MLGGTTSIHFVYVLESGADGKRYIGYTKNLKKRFEEHKSGLVFSTKYRLPLKLIYFEACIDEDDGRRREKYLKATDGRRFLAKRLKSYYKSKLYHRVCHASNAE